MAFSISFEADYPYVLELLAGAGIPLKAADRGPDDPLVLAGGVATFLNPEPLAPFVDAFFLGEGEAGAVPFFEFLAAGSPAPDRAALLQDLARTVPGAYVPAGYTPRYHPDGTLAAFEAAPGFPGAGGRPPPAGAGPLPYPQPPPGPPERVGRDVSGGDRPGLFPGLPLLRRRVCLPPAPGAPP